MLFDTWDFIYDILSKCQRSEIITDMRNRAWLFFLVGTSFYPHIEYVKPCFQNAYYVFKNKKNKKINKKKEEKNFLGKRVNTNNNNYDKNRNNINSSSNETTFCLQGMVASRVVILSYGCR